MVERLVKLGYTRVDFSEKKGDFSLRGDILEVYPISENQVYKLDFFGDEIEKIRTEDGKTVAEITLLQTTDVKISPDEVPSLIKKLKNAYSNFGVLLAKNTVKNLYNKLAEKLETDLTDDSLQYLFPLIENKTHNIFDYLSSDTVIVYDESKIIHSNLVYLDKEHNERCNALIKSGDGLEFIKEQALSPNALLSLFDGKKVLAVQTLSSIIPFLTSMSNFVLIAESGLISPVIPWSRGNTSFMQRTKKVKR